MYFIELVGYSVNGCYMVFLSQLIGTTGKCAQNRHLCTHVDFDRITLFRSAFRPPQIFLPRLFAALHLLWFYRLNSTISRLPAQSHLLFH